MIGLAVISNFTLLKAMAGASPFGRYWILSYPLQLAVVAVVGAQAAIILFSRGEFALRFILLGSVSAVLYAVINEAYVYLRGDFYLLELLIPVHVAFLIGWLFSKLLNRVFHVALDQLPAPAALPPQAPRPRQVAPRATSRTPTPPGLPTVLHPRSSPFGRSSRAPTRPSLGPRQPRYPR